MVDDPALGLAPAGARAWVAALPAQAGQDVGAVGVLHALGAAGRVWVSHVVLDARTEVLGRAVLLKKKL